MEKIKIYVEGGLVHIASAATAIDGFSTSLPPASPVVQTFPTSDELTASVVSTNKIKVVDSQGRIIFTNVVFTDVVQKNGSSVIAPTAAGTRDILNGTSYFNSSTLESQLTTERARITTIENSVKTASGDRGVYITDAKDETSSKLKITTTSAKLQAGSKTGIEADESSPGTLTFTVAAGASGSEVETTALTISGNTQGKTLAEFTTSLFSIKSNSTSGAGGLSLLEASANGTHKLTFRAPAALTADTVLTFPDGAGSNGQVLSTNGAGTLSWVDQGGSVSIQTGASDILRASGGNINVASNLVNTIAADRLVFYDHSATKLTALELGTNLSISGTTLNASFTDTNTNIANTDLTLDAARILNLSGNDLDIQTGGSSKLLYDVSANQGNGEWLFSARARFTQPVEFHATGGTSQSQIRFREPPMGGASSVILKGPSTNLASDLTFVLPDADGSAGQFLKTDGNGNLSFASASGSGGGDGNHYLGQFGGLFTWASADDGERVGLHTTYGPYYFSHSTEPDQAALRNYDASQAVDSATSTMDNYKMMAMGFRVHTTNKKVKCVYSFRIQSAPSSSTWGISLWGGTLDTSGSTNSERTVTLRGKSSDITVVSTHSTAVYHGEFTTTSDINSGSIIPFLENRTGDLTTTTRLYGSFKLYLTD